MTTSYTWRGASTLFTYSRYTVQPRISIVQHQIQQSRTFIDSLLGSALGPCPLRTLTHTKTLPYSSSAIFNAVSDVAGYPNFLPFAISSNVISRDKAGYPTQAQLKVGYDKFGLEENWNSDVHCDPKEGVIEAKSGGAEESSLFEVLKTKWKIVSLMENSKAAENAQTMVQLDVDVKFRNPVYDQMFAQIESKVAASMVSAFEKRVQELTAKDPEATSDSKG